MNILEKYSELLIPEEVCEILRISKASFYKRVWEGQIPTIKLGGLIRVDKNELIKFLYNRKRTVK